MVCHRGFPAAGSLGDQALMERPWTVIEANPR
jgi:hypothetical protein